MNRIEQLLRWIEEHEEPLEVEPCEDDDDDQIWMAQTANWKGYGNTAQEAMEELQKLLPKKW